MAEAKEAAPKKKNMMPVIIAVVVVLLGGGYFMMNGKGKAKDAEEESHGSVHLGHAEDAGEFLVNLKDGTYLSTKISLHCAEKETVSSAGDGHGAGGGILPFVNDAIISVLTSKSMDELTSVEGKSHLRREIAYYVNRAAALYGHEEEGKPKKKLKKSEIELTGTPEELKPGYEPENPELDADEGPVLKVYFLTFTTQR